MKVILAKTAGFCMGVRRAMEMVMAESNKKEGPLFTYGPLIHNQQVLDLLRSKGIQAEEDLENLKSGRIIIRAHGIPPQKKLALEKTGLKVMDGTCPKVTRVQAIIRRYSKEGRQTIIVGDQDHAEVIGLMGYSRSPAHVIQGTDDVPGLPEMDHPFVVAQTTQNEQNFNLVVASLKERFPDLLVFDTICDATHLRQGEVREFKGLVDGVVVVGGYHSGNTRRLVQISEEEGMPTIHVETENELNEQNLSGFKTVGVTAGASTPHWMINSVLKKIEDMSGQDESPIVRFFKRAGRFVVLSNLMAAAGAFSLSYAALKISGSGPGAVFPFLTFLYIYAMYVFNRFLDKEASAYSDPARAASLNEYRNLIAGTGAGTLATALILAWFQGLVAFFMLMGLSIVGIIYSVPVIPERLRHRYRYVKIKDIPGSRALSEALAWVAVITVLPMVSGRVGDIGPSVISGMVVFSLSYARAIFLSVFQVQGDLMVGRETLPITLGEERTLLILKCILGAVAVFLITGLVSGLTGPFLYMMFCPLLTLSLCLLAYEKNWFHPGLRLEAMIEGNFLLTGALAFLWQYL